MPSLQFFADQDDFKSLLQRLNEDDEVAFIVSAGRARGGTDAALSPHGFGRRRWKAVHTVDHLYDGYHALWHIPGGPLPLIEESSPAGDLLTVCQHMPAIPDPWSGWTDARSRDAFAPPFFGPGAHAHIQLQLWTRHLPYSEYEFLELPIIWAHWLDGREVLVSSGFQWSGSHYAPAPASTHRWWNRLKRWMASASVALGPDGGTPPTFWAFPSALMKLKSGIRYSANNFNLDASIRTVNVSCR
jgi:hypothetical protein